jgi:hypothetical protein
MEHSMEGYIGEEILDLTRATGEEVAGQRYAKISAAYHSFGYSIIDL